MTRASRPDRVASVVFSVLALAGLATPALFGQALDESCIVTVSGQTVTVEPDGSWRIPNVPSLPQTTRVRAICIGGPQVLYGSTPEFVVPAGQTAFLPEITLLPQEPWRALDPLMAAGSQVSETYRFVAGLEQEAARKAATRR